MLNRNSEFTADKEKRQDLLTGFQDLLPLLQYFLVLQGMKHAQFFSRDFSVQPDLAHREDFWVQVNIVHVPDNHGQKGEYGFIAVEDDEYVMNPQGKKRETEFDLPHEKSADDHHKRSPSHSPVFEFFDEIVAAILGGIFEEPVGISGKKVF